MTSFAGILIRTILSRFIIHHHLKDKNVRSRNKSYNYLKMSFVHIQDMIQSGYMYKLI
jgi:hypothetical protein